MIDLFRHVLVDDERGFSLHSGGTTHVLFDVPGMLYERVSRDFLITRLYEAVNEYRRTGARNSGIAAIVGVEFGGAIVAALLAERYDHMPLGFYRKSGDLIGLEPDDGKALPGWTPTVLVVDDVVTTGRSISEASAAARALGYETVEACIVDRR